MPLFIQVVKLLWIHKSNGNVVVAYVVLVENALFVTAQFHGLLPDVCCKKKNSRSKEQFVQCVSVLYDDDVCVLRILATFVAQVSMCTHTKDTAEDFLEAPRG